MLLLAGGCRPRHQLHVCCRTCGTAPVQTPGGADWPQLEPGLGSALPHSDLFEDQLRTV